MKQLHIFFAALMFLTRLPIPKWVKHKEEYLQKSTAYFTTVGLVVGILNALIYIGFSYLFTNVIAIVLTMVASIFITGAFHEDGFADCCDAFGGGYTKEKILEIMKDSCLGTYGVTGLFFILFLKFMLWLEVSTTPISSSLVAVPIPYYLTFPILIIVAHSFSRFMPLLVIQNYTYVYQQDASKSKPLASQRLSRSALLFALLVALVGFLFLPLPFLGSIFFMLLATVLLGNYFKKHLGGYTGDCLGAIQQVSELVFYISVLVINKFVVI